MRILVTGGAGFIGSNFVRFILQRHKNDLILNFDKLTYAGNLGSLVDVEGLPNYQFMRGDITSNKDVETAFEQSIDVVVHFAAESHVDRSILDASEFVRTNVLGTQVLLEAARNHGVQKFVHVSTDEVYGSLQNTGFFTEETPLQPNSPYSSSKAGSDLLVRAYHKTYGIPVNITRCSNNYGPYQFPEKLIPLMIINAIEDKPLPVYGDGVNVRDWLHVEDHCRAIEAVLNHGVPGEVYNIGGHNERTNIEVVNTILRALGKPESLIRFVTDRLGHDRRYAIDATKIRNQLGWKPKYSLDVGIHETINWYLGNRSWWEKIRSGAYMDYYNQQYGKRFGTNE